MRHIFFSFVVLFATHTLSATELSVMSYNVENLFDTENDPLYNDHEFTPGGPFEWTHEKMLWKMQNLAKVVKSVSNPDGSLCPDALGLVEVENYEVLEYWRDHFLQECAYKNIIIHRQNRNEPVLDDQRGIKTALMTKKSLGRATATYLPREGGRHILEVVLKVDGKPLTLLVNHWKSRRGGGDEKRATEAEALQSRIYQLTHFDDETLYPNFQPYRDIIAMGDFNDEPEDESIVEHLGQANFPSEMFEDLSSTDLYNASFEKFHLKSLLDRAAYLISHQGKNWNINDVEDEIRKRRSTYYYSGEKEYQQLDHIFLSRGLFHDDGWRYKEMSFQVIRHEEFTSDRQTPIPFRPHRGGAVGGAADHFPVLVRLESGKSPSYH